MPRATSGFGVATALASIPTFYVCSGVIIFAISVSIYGF